MRSFVPGWMRARHETHHTVTNSLTRTPQLQEQTTSKSPGNSHDLLLFKNHKRDLSAGRKFWVISCARNTQSPHKYLVGLPQQASDLKSGGLPRGTGELSLLPPVRAPKRHHPVKLISRGRSCRVDFSVLRACAQNSFGIS